MFGRITLPAVLAATLTLGSLPAAATQPRETPTDLSAFSAAKVSLVQAVKTVEEDTGGIVCRAAFHATPGYGVKGPYGAAQANGSLEGYMVTYIAADTMSVSYVDPQTGLATEAATAAAADYNAKGISEPAYQTIGHDPAALPQAIMLAEQQTGDRAIDAAPERYNGTVGYRVGVVRNGAIRHEWVNPGSGQVASVN